MPWLPVLMQCCSRWVDSWEEVHYLWPLGELIYSGPQWEVDGICRKGCSQPAVFVNMLQCSRIIVKAAHLCRATVLPLVTKVTFSEDFKLKDLFRKFIIWIINIFFIPLGHRWQLLTGWLIIYLLHSKCFSVCFLIWSFLQHLYIFKMKRLILPGLPPTTSIPNAGQLWNLIPQPLRGTVDVIQAAIIHTLRHIFLDKRKSAWQKLSAAIKYLRIHLLVLSVSKCDVANYHHVQPEPKCNQTFHKRIQC